MQIFVRTFNGATKTLSLESSSSIEDVKTLIQMNENVPVEMQTLLFNGKCLDNSRIITDYSIENECTLQLMFSINGGVFDPSLAALAKKFNCEKQVCRK
jgi:Ubiquitin family/Ribosomal L40e family